MEGRMSARIFAGLGIAATAAAAAARLRVAVHPDRLERLLVEAARAAPARDDLPPPVRALAHRLGVRDAAPARLARLTQSGAMRSAPGAAEMPFTAPRPSPAAEPGFVWRARFAPLGTVLVGDYLVAGEGGLDAR